MRKVQFVKALATGKAVYNAGLETELEDGLAERLLQAGIIEDLGPAENSTPPPAAKASKNKPQPKTPAKKAVKAVANPKAKTAADPAVTPSGDDDFLG